MGPHPLITGWRGRADPVDKGAGDMAFEDLCLLTRLGRRKTESAQSEGDDAVAADKKTGIFLSFRSEANTMIGRVLQIPLPRQVGEHLRRCRGGDIEFMGDLVRPHRPVMERYDL